MRSDERPSSETSASKFGYIATVGRGGMADVYLVSSSGPAGFAKLLVVKELRAELANSEEFVEMFLNEARLAARLHHPSIVQTYDVTRHGSRFFLVMEHLDGQPLHRVLARLEAEPEIMLRVYLHAIMAALDGLHYAHELCDYDGRPLELVHRDVSPHNLSVLYSGHVKLVDFGIAKAALGTSNTRAGIVKGKAAYMAPEQAMARRTDCRADIYSCGVMLWEALAGRRIWAGMDEVSIIGRLMHGEVPSLHAAAPGVPAELAAVCGRALAVDPQRRYATAADMADDLERYLRGELVEAGRRTGCFARTGASTFTLGGATGGAGGAASGSSCIAKATSWLRSISRAKGMCPGAVISR